MEENVIKIRRVFNGFIVDFQSADEEHVQSVYEDGFGDDEFAEQSALINLLFDHFGYLFQTKKRGGISIEIKRHGYGEEPISPDSSAG